MRSETAVPTRRATSLTSQAVVAAAGARRHRRLDWLLGALVALGLFCFYLAVQRQEVLSYDGKIMLSVARNLVAHGTLHTDAAVDVFHTNTPYSKYGLGQSLLLAPFSAIQGTTRIDGGYWVTLANPIMLALVGAVMVGIGRAIGWARRWAVLAALAFGLLTMAPNQSTELFSEPTVTFFTLLAVWGCVRWQRDDVGASWLVGLGIGGAMLFRADSIVLTGLTLLFVPMFVGRRRLLREWSWLWGVVVPIAASAATLAWYNQYRYGSLTQFGYRNTDRFSTPLGKGFDELVRLPGKGFFWFNPLLLLALPGLVLLWRRNRALTALVGTLTVVSVLFYAKWASPGGGVGWGPRLLFPLCALLMIPAAEAAQHVFALRSTRRVPMGVLVVGLALAGAGLSVLSVWVPYEQYWNLIAQPRPGDRPNSSAHRQADYYDSIADSPIPGNLRLLARASKFPLSHFEGGPDQTGVLALVGGVASCSAAVGLALVADRRRRPAPRVPG